MLLRMPNFRNSWKHHPRSQSRVPILHPRYNLLKIPTQYWIDEIESKSFHWILSRKGLDRFVWLMHRIKTWIKQKTIWYEFRWCDFHFRDMYIFLILRVLLRYLWLNIKVIFVICVVRKYAIKDVDADRGKKWMS